jgi:hypothetical protein
MHRSATSSRKRPEANAEKRGIMEIQVSGDHAYETQSDDLLLEIYAAAKLVTSEKAPLFRVFLDGKEVRDPSELTGKKVSETKGVLRVALDLRYPHVFVDRSGR